MPRRARAVRPTAPLQIKFKQFVSADRTAVIMEGGLSGNDADPFDQVVCCRKILAGDQRVDCLRDRLCTGGRHASEFSSRTVPPRDSPRI